MTKLKAARPSQAARYELQEKPSRTDTAVETSGLVLETLSSAASLSPIPLLSAAADLVLSFVRIVQVCFSLLISLNCKAYNRVMVVYTGCAGQQRGV